MEKRTITVLRNSPYHELPNGKSGDGATNRTITFQDLTKWVKHGQIFRHLFRYDQVNLKTYDLDVLTKPLLTAVMSLVLSREKTYFEDEKGRRQRVTLVSLERILLCSIGEIAKRPWIIRHHLREVRRLAGDKRSSVTSIDVLAAAVYLRTDLWLGLTSGGSVGHIAGVVNNLGQFFGRPLLLSSDPIPTVRDDIATQVILPKGLSYNLDELPRFEYNQLFFEQAVTRIGSKPPALIYQRYSCSNYCGVKLARRYRVPFVLEYNGSEIWISRHWGKKLKYEDLTQKIEVLNLRSADLIVVVSKALGDELVDRGIAPEKILVNPNGVDPEVYHPDIDGSEIRQKLKIGDRIVIGFIGTFGPWHGAEVLAEAFGRLLEARPDLGEKIHLLLVGDGMTMERVKRSIDTHGLKEAVTMTGMVAQQDGPKYLAAMDILASPHVPNPDGTPFFGSPTKLFEYMAMGRGIVASELDQIGEVLEHEVTAIMVKPGDAEDLRHGLLRLIEDPELRHRLGREARRKVTEKFSWMSHTRRIVERLKAVLEQGSLKG